MTEETDMLRITTEFLFNERIKCLVELSPDFHMSLACLDSDLIMVLLPPYALLCALLSTAKT